MKNHQEIINAYRLWNSMVSGEVIGFTPSNEFEQGGEVYKDNYISTTLSINGLQYLTVPYFQYNTGDFTFCCESKELVKSSAAFLREFADRLEQGLDESNINCPYEK